jgi:dethiobiotin synthetase
MRVVLLGTGTGVGKTTLAVSLARALQQRGLPALALKPVETGFTRGESLGPAAGSDAAQLESCLLHVQQPRPHPLFAFEQPLSPHLAAELSGQSISFDAISRWLSAAEGTLPTKQPALTVIESAGGALSPLTLELTNVDLCRELKAALLILVAPDRLGVLHDVRSTCLAMASVWREPDCVILTTPARPDQSTGTNARELRQLNRALQVFETTSSQGDCPALLEVVIQRYRAAETA